MQLKPEEISKVIRSQIKYYENAIQQNETGTILMVGDGIARASGLINCMAGELLEFEDGNFGMAQNLEENSVSIVIFGSDENIGEGQTVKRTGKVVSVPVGEAGDMGLVIVIEPHGTYAIYEQIVNQIKNQIISSVPSPACFASVIHSCRRFSNSISCFSCR